MVNQQQSVDEVFCAALDLAVEDRAAYLNVACKGAPELRMLVNELLAEDARAGSFLKLPLVGRTPTPSELLVRPSAACAGRDSTLARGSFVPPRFAPTQLIADRFAVIRFLARGGMGEVYEVEDHLLHGERVALKIIRPEIAEEAGSTQRFEQEVLLARKVHHPNLCPIYEIFHCEQPNPPFLFLTMKLLRGETLDAHLRRGRITVRQEAIAICTKLISAVAAIHAAGIVHRDIKPKNVMLERTGSRMHLVLLDFGLARLHHSEATVHKTGMVAGTPGYLAPELLYGQRPTKASDVFALGVVLHQVLTGELPLDAGNGTSMMAAPSLLKAEGPAFLLEAVREFLVDDPEQRCRAFKRVRGGHRAAAPVESVPEAKPQTFTRRHFVGATAVAACGGIAGGAVWKHDWIRGVVDDLLHPLPRKRFVALLDWPPPAEASVRPMILGLIDSMAGELARAEAFDHDFYVTAQTGTREMTTRSQLNQARESLGANLVLAASGRMEADLVHVLLQVVDTVTGKTLRYRELRTSLEEQSGLQERTVRAAAELLNLKRYEPDKSVRGGTDHAAALAAFQSAEALMKQDNDAGLDAAIVKYREATDADPNYAMAFAKLAHAYGRVYGLRLDSGALHLAIANCEHALSLDTRLVEAHKARAYLLEQTGEGKAALEEIEKTLALDPSNSSIRVFQARILKHLDRWTEAEQSLHQAQQQRPNLWTIYSDLGLTLHAQGRWKEAIESFRTAAIAAPKSALAASNLGAEYLQIGEFAAATASLRRSLAMAPNYDGAASNLSWALRYQGKVEEALPFALRAAELNPGEDANWLEVGDCYSTLAHRQQDAKRAYLRAAREAVEHLRSDKTNGPAWMLLALYQAKVGNREDAAASLATADSLFSDDMDSQIYKIRILELLGRRDEALQVLRRSFQRGATALQLRPCPELKFLQSDPRYKSVTS